LHEAGKQDIAIEGAATWPGESFLDKGSVVLRVAKESGNKRLCPRFNRSRVGIGSAELFETFEISREVVCRASVLEGLAVNRTR